MTQTTQEGTPSTLNMDEVAEISGWTDEKNRTTYSPPGRVVPVRGCQCTSVRHEVQRKKERGKGLTGIELSSHGQPPGECNLQELW